MGYTINEDGTVTRDNIPKKTYDTGTSNSTGNSNNGGDSGSGCIIWIKIAIVIGAIFVIANTNKSNSNSEDEVHDCVVCDTISEYYYADSVASNYSYNKAYLSVSPSSVSFSAEGGSRTLSVNSSDSWHISTNTYNWGHLSRNGNSLTLRIDANNSRELRTDYFEISSGTKTYRVNIRQTGMSQVYLNVSPTNATFPSSGGSENIHIDTNFEWSISVNTNSWGHLTRHGNQLILKVDQNTSSSQRTDYFKIKAGNIERTINITQAAVSNSSYNSNRVTGSIRNIWVDHNVTDSYGNYGMRIHVKFDINGMLNRTGIVAAYFYNSNGNALRDTNSNYRTTDGNVATHVNFTPNYENCTFNDLSIFMPYSELHLSRTTSCYFTISIWNGNNEVAQSERNSFHLTY